MKNIFTLFLILPLALFAQLPNLDWVSTTQGPDNAQANGIQIDGAGNLITVGSYFGMVDFDPSGETSTLMGITESGFVQKLDANGELIWVLPLQDSGTGYVTPMAVSTDSENNIFIGGSFFGTVDVDPGEGETLLSALNSEDVFIVKLTENGEFLWGHSFGGESDDDLFDVHVSAADNVFIGGEYEGTMDVDPGEGVTETTSTDARDAFSLGLSADGEFLGFAVFPSENVSRIECITTDDQGNFYLAGAFSGTTDFDTSDGVFELTTAGGSDVFVLKIDVQGVFIWAKSFGSPQTDNVKDIVVDSEYNVITTGYFRQTADFDPGADSFELEAAGVSGQPDGFVNKLDENGDFVWAYAYGGVSYDEGSGLGVDVFNNVYLSGRYAATADFLPGDETLEIEAPFNSDVFALKLNGENGELEFVSSLQATQGSRAPDMEINQTGTMHFAGFYGGMADFDPDPDQSSMSTSFSSGDVFVWTLGQCVLDTVIGLSDDILFVAEQENASYQWYQCDPPISIDNANSFDYAPESDGFYFVEVTLGGCTVSSECIEYSTVGMEDLSALNDIKMFPNPAKTSVQIIGDGILNIQLLSLTGQELNSTPYKTMDVSVYPPGIYLLKIQTSYGTAVRRLVITK